MAPISPWFWQTLRTIRVQGKSVQYIPACGASANAAALYPLDTILGDHAGAVVVDHLRRGGVPDHQSGDLLFVEWTPYALCF